MGKFREKLYKPELEVRLALAHRLIVPQAIQDRVTRTSQSINESWDIHKSAQGQIAQMEQQHADYMAAARQRQAQQAAAFKQHSDRMQREAMAQDREQQARQEKVSAAAVEAQRKLAEQRARQLEEEQRLERLAKARRDAELLIQLEKKRKEKARKEAEQALLAEEAEKQARIAKKRRWVERLREEKAEAKRKEIERAERQRALFAEKSAKAIGLARLLVAQIVKEPQQQDPCSRVPSLSVCALGAVVRNFGVCAAEHAERPSRGLPHLTVDGFDKLLQEVRLVHFYTGIVLSLSCTAWWVSDGW